MPVLGPSMHPGGLRGFSMVRLPVALLLGQVLEENDVKRVGSVCGRGLGKDATRRVPVLEDNQMKKIFHCVDVQFLYPFLS